MTDTQANQFYGLSSLRSKEKAQQPKTENAKALDDYLKRYTDSNTGTQVKKKRKKKAAPLPGVRIVDEDVSGFHIAPKRLPPRFDVEAQGSGDDSDGPVIANPGEADLYRRQQAKEKSGAAFANWSSADPNEARRFKKPRHDTPDASPPRKAAQNEGPDNSPPRRRPRHDTPDESPLRQKPRHDSPDASPPRRKRHDTPDASPPRRKARHDSPDASPPRRGARQDSSDASPPRRTARPEVMDPALSRRAKHEPPDASPPRRKVKQESPDASPPRRGQIVERPKSGLGGAGGKMADGTSAGMISAGQLAGEIALKRKAEQERYQKLEEKHGSRHAETVYRDRETGRILTKEDFEAAQKKAAEKKRPKYETPEWGGGLRQKQLRAEEKEEIARQAAKPFARTQDDVDEDLNLRDRARFGDPMAHLAKNKSIAPLPPAVPEYMAKALKKGGFAIPQEVPQHSWLRRNMGPPPNRYGIKPGRHWDGVDRSTGFEREMFKMIAARAANEREARAWAQSDM